MTLEEQIRKKIDLKTKPVGALGHLEQLALKIALVQKTLTPSLKSPTQIVFAADHGLAKSGVSAYPPEVTYQMVMNFLAGGAAINVFCKQNDIAIYVVDAGVNFDFTDHPSLIKAKAGYGTQNALYEKAMTAEQLLFCLSESAKIVDNIFKNGCNIIGFGEMGIGNTSSASLIMASLLNKPVEECVGRGTGVNDEQLEHKIRILKQVIDFHGPIIDSWEILQTFGGFEIAQMYGAMLQAHQNNMLIMVDGFIATAAYALVHVVEPSIEKRAIFCHISDESPHRVFVDALNQKAILDLNLRVGEGSGCALAYPIIQAAVNFLNEMASFESAGVSNK